MLISGSVMAKDNKNSKSVKKPAGQPQTYKLNINNISTYIYATAETDIDGSNPGMEWPKGSNKHPVYQSGFLWGADVNGQIRVGGTTYNSGLLPGAILPDGTAENPEDPDVRMWRVRPDWETGGMSTEIREGEGSEAEIRAQYQKDWNEWPASKGAPFEDIDSNGVYDPSIDIPGVPGASQTIWFVTNDLNNNQVISFYGSPSMGVEVQITIWAYSSVGPLGNMDFRKYKMINKSNDTFQNMYVSAWSDADIGDGTDDYAGVDTVLSLGYVYNGTAHDGTYLDNPPATGFDFFQGPIIEGTASDTAMFGGQKRPGFKNLPATAFYYFINADQTYGDPDLGEYQTGTLEFYNLMQGKIGKTGEYFPVPDALGGGVTKFPLSGDPVAQTGYLDGIYFNPNDRRYGLASGPFTMAPADTQEIVLAQIVAGGAGYDNIQAVQLLKSYDAIAQDAYNSNFVLPSPPPAPIVKTINLDKEVVLTWSDPVSSAKTENHDLKGYKFEGYNIYQLPSASATMSEAKRVATFDIENDVKIIKQKEVDPETGETVEQIAQYGSDSGIKRFIDLKRDYLNNKVLINGTRYYFAVTSYAYNPDPLAVPSTLENPVVAITVTPQEPLPGDRYAGSTSDTLDVQRISGISNGEIIPMVIDPSSTTGHTYQLSFRDTIDAAKHAVTYWSVLDKTTNKSVLTDQTNQSGDFNYPIVDGLMIKVIGPEVAVKGYSFTPSADRWFTGVGSTLEAMGGGLGVGANFWGNIIPGADYKKVEVRFKTNADGQKAYRYLRGTTPNYLYQDYTPQHFTVWDVTSQPAKQLAVAYIEQSGAAAANSLWQPTEAYSDREYMFILDSPYTEQAVTPFDTIKANNPALPVMFAWWPLLRDGYTFNPQDGQVLTITPNFVNTPNDVFTFTAPVVTKDNASLTKEDVERIKAFPNPYYGVNPQELNKYERFVTFSHMPPKAKIRVYNLAGQLVRVMDKDDNSQFYRWDLANDKGLPVASGIFIVYIDMPEIGATKILKVAIIQEQQILDRF
jgi:hypothetical protein